MLQIRTLASTAILAVALLAACGGDQSVASKSAAAHRDAKAKGVAVGAGHDHGGHGAPVTATAGDHSTMTGTDHSSMTGMDHAESPSTNHSTMTGMDHSRMSSAGLPATDHSAMQHGAARSGQTSMAGMDHGSMPGMQHGTTSRAQHSREAMDHGSMQHGSPSSGRAGAQMDHSTMQHAPSHSASGDHSAMPATQHDTAHPARPEAAGMDHSGMHAMQSSAAQPQQPAHGAHAAAPPSAAHAHGTTTAVAPAVRPARESGVAMTLRPDAFDTPAPVAVSEAAKAARNIAEPDIRQIVPGTDSENPPSPAPAIRSGTGAAPAAGEDHSRHGATAEPPPAPAPAVDHSQHGATPAAPAVDPTRHGAAPAPAPRARPRSTQPKPVAQTIYSCPMHPEVTSPKPGTCPKCGMTLVKKNG